MITCESLYKIRTALKVVQELTPEEQQYMMSIMTAFKDGGKAGAINAIVDGFMSDVTPAPIITSKPVRCDPDDQ